MRVKSYLGPVLGIAALITFLLLPPMEPITELGMKTLGIFLFTVIWWATVGVSYPSILCIALLAITGVMTSEEVFAGSLGSWLISFLLGCFGLSEALRTTGFSRRFALWFMTRPITVGRPWVMLGMFLLACTLMGSIMSSTVTTIVFMAIATPILEAMGYKKGDRFASMFMMGIAWAATASLSMTPIAHAGNVLVMEWIKRDVGYGMSFAQWMFFGIPMGLLVFLVILGVFRFVIRPDISRISDMTNSYVKYMKDRLGQVKREEKIALGVFGLVVLCWILPGIASGVIPEVTDFLDNLGYAIPALVGVCALCLIRVKGQPILTFEQWFKDGTSWGSLILVAAIMVLGSAISNPETGIFTMLTGIFEPLANNMPFMVFLLIGVLWVVLQTNIMSNLVSMTLVYSILVPVAIATGIGNPAALGATITAASNYAFSLPSATTTTAIVIGSGWVSVGFMGRYGTLMIIPVVLIFVFICYPLVSAILGG